jgi:hypothetical protein
VDSSAEHSRAKNSADLFVALALFAAVLAAAALCVPRATADDNALQAAAEHLAERVASIPGVKGPLRFDWRPDEKWTEGEGRRWQEALRDAFDAHSLGFAQDAAAAAPYLAVYAEETPTHVVLTAKLHLAERDEVRIVQVARALLSPSELPAAPVRLDRQLIYESPDRILDASSLWSTEEGGLALLLYKNFEVVAQRIDAKGAVQKEIPLVAANLKPVRDPHAEMNPRGSFVSVQLWGKACDFTWNSPSDVKCHADKPSPPGKSLWRPPTGLTAPCDESGWKLEIASNEPGARGVLQIVPDGAVLGSSASVLSEFPGPILSTSGEANLNGALVVIRNLRTGNYEVYKISLACGD